MTKVPNKFPLVNTETRIALVGEAPGADEERQGEPFVGSSGFLLNKLLQEAKILRNAAFIGNVYQYRPPGNDIKKISRSSEEWTQSVAQLKADLAQFNPQVTIAFGETALNVLTGRESISKWRGSILYNSLLQNDSLVVPTFHPTYILRQWSWRPIALSDIEKARDEILNPQPLPSYDFLINPTFTEAMAYLQDAHSYNEIAVDFETTMDKAVPLCLGFATSERRAFCIPFDDRWTDDEHFALWQAIDDLMSNPKVGKIFQNAQFDISVFAKWTGICVQNVVMDTMLAHHACYPEWPKSLAFQCSIYTREPYYKEDHKEDSEEKTWNAATLTGDRKDKFYIYNCKDCCVTFEIAQYLRKELGRLNAWGGFKTDMDSLAPALEMMFRGIKVDSSRAMKESLILEEKIEANNKLINELFGWQVNVASPQQMKRLLYGTREEGGLGLPPVYKKVKGRRTDSITADKDAIIELARKYPHGNLKLLLKTRQLRTAQAFFSLDTYKDGKIHASFNVAGTETGRWSSSSSIWGGRGIMNIPEGAKPPYVNARVHFVPDDGKVLVGWDKAQAEARFVAYKSALVTNDSSYKQVVEGKDKIHIWLGKQLILYGICPLSEDEFVARETDDANTWYFISKVAVHGFSYDLGAEAWSRHVAKTTDGAVIVQTNIAKAIKEVLYQSASSIPAWHRAIQKYLNENAIMYNAFGRARVFFDRRGDDLYREAYAFEPQATVADDVARAIRAIYNTIPEAELLQQNYDSLLCQVEKGKEDEVMKKMLPIVTHPITVWDFEKQNCAQLVIPVEFKVGYSWGEMSEVEIWRELKK